MNKSSLLRCCSLLLAALVCAPLLRAADSPGPKLKNTEFIDTNGDGMPDAWQAYPPPTGANQKMTVVPGDGVKITDQDANVGLGLAQWVSVTPGNKFSAKLSVSGEGNITLYLIFTPTIPAKASDVNTIKISEVTGSFSAARQDPVLAEVPAGAQFMRVFVYSTKPGKCDLTVKSIELKAVDTGAPAVSRIAAPASTAGSKPNAGIAFTCPEIFPAGKIWTADLETGDFTQFRWLEGGKKEVISAPEPVRNGKHAVKVMLTHDQHRTEVSGPRGSGSSGEFKYGWSIFIPETFDANSFFSIVTQWHTWGSGKDYPPDGGPPTSISIAKEKWSMKIQYQDGDQFKTAHTYIPFGSITGDRGKWTDFYMEVNWESPKAGGGYLRLYKNGEKVIDYAGPTWFEGKTKTAYFKMGIYKGSREWRGDESGAVLYFDEIRMGDKSATRDQIDPARQPRK